MGSYCFINKFEDYTFNNSKKIIENEHIKSGSKILKDYECFWNEAWKLFKTIKSDDYSVFTGTSGIALLYLQKGINPFLLKDAVTFLGLEKLSNRGVTFLFGDAGPLAIGAVIFHMLHNEDESNRLIERLLLLAEKVLDEKSDLPNGLFYGRAGYLYALLFINTHINPAPIEENLIKKIIAIILARGQYEARTCVFDVPLIYNWRNKHYLGAAHGLSGILYILLQAKEYLTQSDLQLIRSAIDFIIDTRNELINFMVSLENDCNRLVQWCHGAPGFTHMFCKAYEVFADKKYLKIALECGDIIWRKGLLRKGYSICHGVAGNGYTFLELFKNTRDPKHLYRAAKFAEWCLSYNRDNEYNVHRPISLFLGIAGRLYFLGDLRNPMEAKFPAFTL